LTLNLGLRYDVQTGVWLENLFEQEQPEIRLGERVFRPGGRLDRALFPFWEEGRGDNNNIGPRAGLAWDFEGTGRQVLRFGWGVYYNRYRANSAANELDVRASQIVIQNPSYPDPFQGRDPFTLASVSNIFRVQSNESINPYTHQFSVGYSRQLAPNLGISIDGTFANGKGQHTTIDRNYFATPEDRARAVRPRGDLGRITEDRTDGELRYRALDMRVERRLANRWQILGSYTLAWAKNDIEGLPADQFNRDADFGFAEADRRHRAVLSGSVEIPGALVVSSILRYQSPLPFDVTAGADLNRDTLTNDRPEGVTRNQGCRGVPLDAVNVYRSASGRTPVEGITCADFVSLDAQLSRAFRLGGERRITALIQVFNILNRANYFAPVGNALSPLFGQTLQVSNPRQGEVALRFSF
jgi:hypothetical protein